MVEKMRMELLGSGHVLFKENTDTDGLLTWQKDKCALGLINMRITYDKEDEQ